MNAKELAAILNGIEYPCRIQSNILAQAAAAGLVIVYGGSDDLMEFAGLITDEAGVYNGGKVDIDIDGVIPDFVEVEHGVESCQKWLARYEKRNTIEALWCKEDGYSWTYRTQIPHETFDVKDGDGLYCRGIVFSVEDLYFSTQNLRKGR